jgi:hypothetical protein
LVELCSRFTEGIDIVQQSFCPSTVVPRSLAVDEATLDGSGALITVRAMTKTSVCPGCGTPSERVHSRYRRRLADPADCRALGLSDGSGT